MIERNIYHDGNLVVANCSGIVTSAELIQHANWMVKGFGTLIKPGFSHLFNAINAEVGDISEETIHQVAYINISFSKARGKFAVSIVAAQPYPLELASLHKHLSVASNIEVEIFSNTDAAYKWLGFEQPD